MSADATFTKCVAKQNIAQGVSVNRLEGLSGNLLRKKEVMLQMLVKILASGSNGNCYLVDDGTTTILLDAGIPIKQIQRGSKFRLSKVSSCLVTHEHL